MTKGMKDIVSGSILFALSIAMFVAGLDIKKVLPVGVGSGFFPEVVGAALGLIAALIVVQGVRALGSEGGRQAAPAGTDAGTGAGWVVLATLLLIGFYVAFLKPLGFIPTTFLYLVGQFTVLAPKGQRNIVAFVVVAAVVSVATYYLFLKVFELMLPTGILG